MSQRDPRSRAARWGIAIRIVRERDGFRCVTERHAKKVGWGRCGKRNSQTAHVIRRSECGAKWDHPDVLGRICGDCHRQLHARHTAVRWPAEVQTRAMQCLIQAYADGELKVLPKGALA